MLIRTHPQQFRINSLNDPQMEAACRAARRYAQMLYHHYNSSCRYDGRPALAWEQFLGQFKVMPGGAVIASVIGYDFAREMRRLSRPSEG